MFSNTHMNFLLVGSSILPLAACMPAPLAIDPILPGINRNPDPKDKINPEISGNFADPAAIVQGDVTLTYSTTNNGQNVPVRVNGAPRQNMFFEKFKDDADNKTLKVDSVQDAMPTQPKWSPPGKAGVWAPDVMQLASGSFVLYFSATSAQDESKHCVGAATSDFATGPFVPQDNYLACPLDQGGAIDPSGFTDSDGSTWVVYKVDGNSLGGGGPCGNANGKHGTPIMLQEVDRKDGVTPVGKPTEILNREKHDGPLIEAPSLIKSPGGTYVLFFSSNCYNTALYDISYATSKSLKSGYSKVKGQPLLQTGDHGLFSPGGASAYSGKDGSKIVFHADLKYGDPSVREMYESGISIDDKKGTVTLTDLGKNDMASKV